MDVLGGREGQERMLGKFGYALGRCFFDTVDIQMVADPLLGFSILEIYINFHLTGFSLFSYYQIPLDVKFSKH